MARYELELGDEIIVMGRLFILTNLEEKRHRPAKVTFKQPVELLTIEQIREYNQSPKKEE